MSTATAHTPDLVEDLLDEKISGEWGGFPDETPKLRQKSSSDTLGTTMYTAETMKRAAPEQGTGRAPEPILVTKENVKELFGKFKTLPSNDPLYNPLGDALHEYMLG